MIAGYFVLTFVASWTCFATAAAISGPSSVSLANSPLLLLGVFAPGLIALAFTAWQSGRPGAISLLYGIVRAPPAARWYVFAAGYTVCVKLTAAVVHRATAGTWPAFGRESLLVMLLATIVSTPVQAGEEVGWRGYGLPRLAASLGLGPASIVLGAIWACWHLPLFFVPAADTYHQSFPVYLLTVTAFSVALAWLYWRTNGSLLLTMLLHAAINNTKDIVPSAPQPAANPFFIGTSRVGWITAGLLWLCATYFLVRMRGATLPPAIVQDPDDKASLGRV